MAQPVAEMNSTADALRAELAPSGLLQSFLVGQIALGMDRLTRAADLEDRDDPSWLKYHAQAERTFYKALTEFRRLVTVEAKARKENQQAAVAPSPSIARASTNRPAPSPNPEPSVSPPSATAGLPDPSAAAPQPPGAEIRDRRCDPSPPDGRFRPYRDGPDAFSRAGTSLGARRRG